MITEEMAKQAAEQGLIPALKCSRDKWQWPVDVSYEDFVDVVRQEIFSIGIETCSLCHLAGRKSKGDYVQQCIGCVLNDEEDDIADCCAIELRATGAALDGFEKDMSRANADTVRDKCKAMVARLDAEIAKAEQAECKYKKQDKPELRRGDYGRVCSLGDYKNFYIVGTDPEGFNDDLIVKYITNKPNEGCTNSGLKHLRSCEYTIYGNLEDDLAVLGEDLESFKYKLGGRTMEMRLDDGEFIWREDVTFSSSLRESDIEKVAEFHKNLGRLIATARRNNQKSK